MLGVAAGGTSNTVEDPIGRYRDRAVLVGVVVLTGLAFVRTLYWMLALPIPFGDEVAHYAFIQWLATGHGIPVTGTDHVTRAALQLAKSTPVEPWRQFTLPPDPSAQWSLVGQQYEAFQGPLYHTLMVVPYWIGRALGGVLGSLYLIRLATVTLVAAGVPAVYILAKEVFPTRRAVWLLAPAVVVAMQLLNSAAALSNDSIMTLAGALTTTVLLRSRHDLRPRRAVIVGGSLALCLLAKTTAVALMPGFALLIGWYWVQYRPPLKVVVGWVAGVSVGGLILLGPWLGFNLETYGALTGAKQQAALVVKTIGVTPPGWRGIRILTKNATDSLFTIGGSVSQPLRHSWNSVAVYGASLAVIGGLVRGRRRELEAVLWLIVSPVLGLLVLAATDLSQSGGGAALTGRHLDVLVPMFALLMGYGASALLGARVGTALLLSCLVYSTFAEVPADRAFLTAQYTRGIIGSAVPVVQQTYADRAVSVDSVRVRSTCVPTDVALIIQRAIPKVTVDGRTATPEKSEQGWNVFNIPSAPTGWITVDFSEPSSIAVGSQVSVADVDPIPGGTPAVELYCSVPNPKATRFAELYRPDHPFPMSYAALDAWPVAEAWVGLILAVAAFGLTLVFSRRSQRAPDAAGGV